MSFITVVNVEQKSFIKALPNIVGGGMGWVMYYYYYCTMAEKIGQKVS